MLKFYIPLKTIKSNQIYYAFKRNFIYLKEVGMVHRTPFVEVSTTIYAINN